MCIASCCAVLICSNAHPFQRILKLTTAQLSEPHATLLDDGITLDRPLVQSPYSQYKTGDSICHWVDHVQQCVVHSGQSAEYMGKNTEADVRSVQTSSLQILPAKIYLLTEWVYKFLASPWDKAEEVVAVYRDCLDWYETCFTLLKEDGSNPPYLLFIQ